MMFMVRKSINYIQDYVGSVVRNVEQLIVIATHLPLKFDGFFLLPSN